MFYLFLLFSVLWSLHGPQSIFSSPDSSWTDVAFYEQVFKEDWDGFSSEKKEEVFNEFIKKELAVLGAKRAGVLLHPNLRAKLQNRKEIVLINNTYEHLVARPHIDSTALLLNRAFLQHSAETYHLLIGFNSSSQDTKSSISQDSAAFLVDSLLLAINARILQDEPPVSVFSEFCINHSIDPSVKQNGGFLGWVPWGRTVMSFQQPLFEGLKNLVLGPILTEYGYHLILKTGVRPSNHYYYSKKHYNDLAYKVSLNSSPFDSLRSYAASFDSLLIKQSGLKFNRPLVNDLLFFINEQQLAGRGNKNSLIAWLDDFSMLVGGGVLVVFNEEGFGFGWLINKLKNEPSTRVPKISVLEDLFQLVRSFVLRDLVLDLGKTNNIEMTTSFKRDLMNNYKNIIYNEYVSFLLAGVASPDSALVIEQYDLGVFNKDFVLPRRVVFSEIRVFDSSVADSAISLLNHGSSFDSLLGPFGGSVREPVSLGAKHPLALVAFSLSEGDVSTKIDNNDGSFSILRVERFLEESPSSLSRVYSQIERKLLLDEQEQIKLGLLPFLLKGLDVVLFPGVLGL